MLYYFDSSALVKIFLAEPEQQVFSSWLANQSGRKVCSALVLTEVKRAIRKGAIDEARRSGLLDLDVALDGFSIAPISESILKRAGQLEPLGLRSLDAIHLATALALQPELDGLVTYDNRLAEAARFHGIKVVQPG